MPKGILNKASLVMVPEAPIDGTMPSVFPEDRSGDFTFTRGSNLSATRVASNGLIEKGRENLLTYSNDFSDSDWVKFHGSSVTSGQADKDGGTDAWKLDIVSSQLFSGLYQVATGSGVRTQSIYAKAGTLDHLGIVNMTGSGFAAWFDLTNGTIGTQGGSNIDAKIEAVGTDGWYRISITQSVAQNYFQIKPSDGETTPSGSDGYVYIQDAQLEVGLVATDYIESGATTGKAGLLENEPRIDFTGGGCGSLLLEPQRTNLVPHSEYLNSGAYFKTGTTITDNYGISPEGVQNSSLFNFGATGSSANFGETLIGLIAGTSITYTIYVKGSGTIRIYSDGNGSGGYFFYSTNITLTDEWVRQELTYTIPAGVSAANFVIQRQPSDTATQAEFYGFQVEAGSYPTSYIPTYGSAVTRNADDMYTTNVSNLLSISEGTLYAECDIDASVNTEIYLMRFEGTDFNNTVYLYRKSSGGVQAVYRILGTTYAAETSYAVSGNFKIAASYSLADGISLFLNGVKVSNIAIPEPVYTFIRLRIGGFNATLAKQSGHTKEIMAFPTALTDEECSALTQP